MNWKLCFGGGESQLQWFSGEVLQVEPPASLPSDVPSKVRSAAKDLMGYALIRYDPWREDDDEVWEGWQPLRKGKWNENGEKAWRLDLG